MKIVVDIPDELCCVYENGEVLTDAQMLISGVTLSTVLDKISAEIKELPKAHCIQFMDREDIPLLALDIIEKYKGGSK